MPADVTDIRNFEPGVASDGMLDSQTILVRLRNGAFAIQRMTDRGRSEQGTARAGGKFVERRVIKGRRKSGWRIRNHVHRWIALHSVIEEPEAAANSSPLLADRVVRESDAG